MQENLRKKLPGFKSHYYLKNIILLSCASSLIIAEIKNMQELLVI